MRILLLTLAIGSLLILPSLTNAQKYANDDSLILYLPFNEGEGIQPLIGLDSATTANWKVPHNGCKESMARH